MIDAPKVVRNSLFMSANVLVGGVILFLVFVLIARHLRVEVFGNFVFIVTLASIFQLFADGGVINVTVRDIAREREARQRILGSTKAFVWMVTVILSAVVWGLTEWLAPSPALRAAAFCMAAAALIALHGLLYAAVLRAYEDMGVVALVSFAHKLLLLVLVLAAIGLGSGIEGIAAVHVAANLLQWSIFSLVVSRRFGRGPARVDVGHWRYLVREAVPMGVGLVARRMTVHLGTLLLAVLAGSVAVGLYNSAYRMLQMLEIGALAVTGVLLPVFSRLYLSSPAQFRRLYQHSVRAMVVLAALAGGLLIAFGEEAVTLLYGADYAAATPVLRILGFAFVFVVPCVIMHSVFSAMGEQKLFMSMSLIGIVTNAVLGLLLIPRWQSLGAAVATLVTEIVLFVAGASYLHRREIGADYLRLYAQVAVLAGAPAVLALAVDAWEGPAMLALGCVGYALTYALLVVAAGVVTPDEVAWIRSAALRAK